MNDSVKFEMRDGKKLSALVIHGYRSEIVMFFMMVTIVLVAHILRDSAY